MHDLIDTITTIMTDVSTGKARIEEKNDYYKIIFRELDGLLVANHIQNPNEYTDLWEFYNYWKLNLKSYADRRLYVINLYKILKPKSRVVKTGAYNFVNITRIDELKNLTQADFDTSRLIRLCEELNIVFAHECYISTAMLVRAITDHVAPIFKKENFKQVANNHGSKSFRDSMNNLDNSLRKISDSHLHTQIRQKEVLPNSNQVDFSNDLDVLLAEIYRIMK